MIALPITATISPATAMSNAIIGLSSAAAAGHQCVRKTFEQRQFRQAVRIGAFFDQPLAANAAANRAKFSIWCSGSVFGLRCVNTGEARLQIAEHVLVPIAAHRFVQLRQTSRRRARARAMRFSRVRKHEN